MPIVLKSGSLNLLEHSGSVQACNGTALPLQVTKKEDDAYEKAIDCLKLLTAKLCCVTTVSGYINIRTCFGHTAGRPWHDLLNPLSFTVYIYIYIYIYIHIYIYICVCVCVCVYICIHTSELKVQSHKIKISRNEIYSALYRDLSTAGSSHRVSRRPTTLAALRDTINETLQISIFSFF